MERFEIETLIRNNSSVGEYLEGAYKVSLSQYKAYNKCQMQWALEKIFGREQKSFFAVGSAVHKMLELYAGQDGLTEEDSIAGGLEELSEHPTEADLVVGMFKNYIDYAKENPDYTIIAKEFKFDLVSRFDPTVRMHGIIDAIAIMNRDYVLDAHNTLKKGDIILVEYKTAKGRGNIDYETDFQVSMYLNAVSMILGQEIKYIVFNTMFKKVPKKPAILKNGGVSVAKCSTTASLYEETLIEVYGSLDEAPEPNLAFLANLKVQPNPFVERTYVYRNRTQLDRFQRQFDMQYHAIANAHRELMDAPTKEEKLSNVYCVPTKDCMHLCGCRELCIKYHKGEPLVADNAFLLQLTGDVALREESDDGEGGDE